MQQTLQPEKKKATTILLKQTLKYSTAVVCIRECALLVYRKGHSHQCQALHMCGQEERTSIVPKEN